MMTHFLLRIILYDTFKSNHEFMSLNNFISYKFNVDCSSCFNLNRI